MERRRTPGARHYNEVSKSVVGARIREVNLGFTATPFLGPSQRLSQAGENKVRGSKLASIVAQETNSWR